MVDKMTRKAVPWMVAHERESRQAWFIAICWTHMDIRLSGFRMHRTDVSAISMECAPTLLCAEKEEGITLHSTDWSRSGSNDLQARMQHVRTIQAI